MEILRALTASVAGFFSRVAAGERARAEAYLGEATSIHDLEARMRQLDRGEGPGGLGWGATR